MFFSRYKYLIITLTIIVALVSIVFLPRIKVKFDFQSFSLENDPDLKFYQEYLKNFTSDNNYLMIAIHEKNGIFSEDFLKKFNRFTKDCKRIRNIKSVTSLTTLYNSIVTPMNVIRYPLVHINNPAKYKSDSLQISTDSKIMNWLVSKDFKSAVVLLEVKKNTDEKSKDILISKLDELIEQYHFAEVHLAGNINLETRYIRMIGKEITQNIILCTIIVIIFLWITFRSLVGILIPFISVLLGMIIFYGYLGLFNKSLNVLSTLFPSIMLIVGISNLIRVFSKYQDVLNTGIEKNSAMKITIDELMITLFLTSATTAIGFFSLTTSSIKPFRDFGIDAGIGVIIAFIVGITFAPSLLIFIKPSSIIKEKFIKNSFWNNIPGKVFAIVNNHSWKIVYVSAIIIIISLIGIYRIDTNNYRLGNFSEKSVLRKDAAFFENNLSGIRSFEIAVIAKGNAHINDLENLKDIDKLQNYLSGFDYIGVIFSPVTLYKSINQSYNFGSKEYFKLPEEESEIKLYDNILCVSPNNLANHFISGDKKYGRIIGWMKDIGSDSAEKFRSSIAGWIRKNIKNDKIEFRNTGTELLSDKDNEYLMRNMILNLGLAFLLISIIMGFLFRDIIMVIISLIPNILPLLFLGGLVGFAGIVFNASISIIFSIGFVIAIDDTIHFLSKFNLEYKKCGQITESLKKTIYETSRAMTITSVILILGFLVLIKSQLNGVFYQGILISVLLLVALLADLFLTPSLIKLFWGINSNTELNSS